ncbi:hypothetical protein SFUMM280S_05819 [Streptomyces fumanus]
MKRIARRAVLAGLSSAALLTSLSLGATNAAAINEVPCGSEFVKLQLHYSGGGWFDRCYANAGQVSPSGRRSRAAGGVDQQAVALGVQLDALVEQGLQRRLHHGRASGSQQRSRSIPSEAC